MRIASVLLAGCALAGCATRPVYYDPVIPFEGDSASALRVQNASFPEKASAFDQPINYSAMSNSAMTYNPSIAPDAAAAGGIIAMLIVAGIDAGIDGARNDKVNKFLAAHNFDAKKIFEDALGKELGAAGYRVDGIGLKGGDTSQALIMDVTLPYYGYRIIGPQWTPVVTATVVVKSADGKTILADDSFVTGAPASYIGVLPYYGAGGDAIILPYNPAHVLANEDAITLGDPTASLAGLKFSLETVARGVADLVRKSAPAAAPAATAAPVAQ